MLSYPGHLLTQTEVSVREHDVCPLLRMSARLFQAAAQRGLQARQGGGNPSLSDLLIWAIMDLDLPTQEQRALLHILGETRDCVFELAARQDAFGQ
jgi:hypothetical protein